MSTTRWYLDEGLRDQATAATTALNRFKCDHQFFEHLKSVRAANVVARKFVTWTFPMKLGVLLRNMCWKKRPKVTDLQNDPHKIGISYLGALHLVREFFRTHAGYVLLIPATAHPKSTGRGDPRGSAHVGVIFIWSDVDGNYVVRQFDPNPSKYARCMTPSKVLRQFMAGRSNIDIITCPNMKAYCFAQCLLYICQVVDGADPRETLPSRTFNWIRKIIEPYHH